MSELCDTIPLSVVLLRAISLTAELREDFASTGSSSVSEVGQIAPSVVLKRTVEGAAASRFDKLTVPDAGWTSLNLA